VRLVLQVGVDVVGVDHELVLVAAMAHLDDGGPFAIGRDLRRSEIVRAVELDPASVAPVRIAARVQVKARIHEYRLGVLHQVAQQWVRAAAVLWRGTARGADGRRRVGRRGRGRAAIGHHDAVATLGLRSVYGVVGGAQQAGGVRLLAAHHGAANAHRHDRRHGAALPQARDRLAQLFADGRQRLGIAAWQQRDELVAAKARKLVRATQRPAQGVRHRLQRAVAGQVPLPVIHVLEMVHVDHQQAQRVAQAARLLRFLVQQVLEGAAIEEARQRVGERVLLALLVELAQLMQLAHAAGGATPHPHARQQLLDVKGLGHVVVGAALEGGSLLVRRLQSGQHEDRQVGAARLELPHLRAQLQAVDVGQPPVEQQQVGPLLVQRGQRGAAVHHPAHVMASAVQRHLHHLGGGRIVLHDQDRQ
jgi:hypothetical protein